MDYIGTIIKESLADESVLADLNVTDTIVEPVTERHHTPWLKNWTKLKVFIPEEWAEFYAERLSEALDAEHPWYADYKNDDTHYIIFYGRIFMIDRREPDAYQDAKEYGRELGIPDHQLDFK